MKTITKFVCERCLFEFPNEAHALECETRHRSVQETYRRLFEEASKIVPAPSYESWPAAVELPALPRPVHICTTVLWSYWWWKPYTRREGFDASIGLSGDTGSHPVITAPSLDAACEAWLEACKIESSCEFSTDNTTVRYRQRAPNYPIIYHGHRL